MTNPAIPGAPVRDANLPPGKRDAPRHPPWWIAYAEHGDRYVRLRQFTRDGQVLFSVGAGRSTCDCQPGSDIADCPERNHHFGPLVRAQQRYRHCWPHCLPRVWPRGQEGSPDYAKALACWQQHADALAEEEA